MNTTYQLVNLGGGYMLLQPTSQPKPKTRKAKRGGRGWTAAQRAAHGRKVAAGRRKRAQQQQPAATEPQQQG